jgi:hypothetical protein
MQDLKKMAYPGAFEFVTMGQINSQLIRTGSKFKEKFEHMKWYN